mmetsp:Transcript_8039/g.23599  ORF Transcript_8039/g.23599 Transcript_8039/m.23599 type:complete len:214 (-) Transcript_8039:10-651(-)
MAFSSVDVSSTRSRSSSTPWARSALAVPTWLARLRTPDTASSSTSASLRVSGLRRRATKRSRAPDSSTARWPLRQATLVRMDSATEIVRPEYASPSSLCALMIRIIIGHTLSRSQRCTACAAKTGSCVLARMKERSSRGCRSCTCPSALIWASTAALIRGIAGICDSARATSSAVVWGLRLSRASERRPIRAPAGAWRTAGDAGPPISGARGR